MQGRHARLTVVVITLLAVGVPVLASLYLAYRESISEASTQTRLAAGEVLGRAETMADQMMAVYRRMQALKAAPCSAAGRQQMIEIALDYSYVKAVGYISGNRVVCSSFAAPGQVGTLKPFAYTSTLGVRVSPSDDLGTGKPFLVLAKGNYATAALPQALVDIPFDNTELFSGVFGESSGVRLAGTGKSDPAWRERLGSADQVTFFDGRQLVTVRKSTRYDLASYSAIPLAYLRSRFVAVAGILVPIGLLLGVAAALAILSVLRRHASLPALLRGALKRREFVVHYQPIVELASGRMVGAEALLRWPGHDAEGMSPAVFIPVAEDCGLIRQLTAYVLTRVAVEAPAFIRQHPEAYISINLSPFDLHDEQIVEQLRQLLDGPGMAAENLIVEVTEHSFLDPKHASGNIAAIRALGVRVAIDDFGTGFSSLSHLTTLKTDYLKIDKVFIESIGTESATCEVAQHIVHVAHSLGLTVIAEGVERQPQADFLRELGVMYAQGWLFSAAQPMEALLRGEKGVRDNL